jgi:hypothetical protein
MPSNRKATAIADERLAGQNSPQNHLTDVAEHTLGFFSETAANALEELGQARPQSDAVFAVVNTLTAERVMRNLEGIKFGNPHPPMPRPMSNCKIGPNCCREAEDKIHRLDKNWQVMKDRQSVGKKIQIVLGNLNEAWAVAGED